MGGSSKMLEPLAELLGGELTSGIPLLDYLLGWESVGHRPITAPDDEPHRTGDDGRLGGQDQGPPEPHPAPTPAVHVSPAVAIGSGLGESCKGHHLDQLLVAVRPGPVCRGCDR